MRRKRIENLLNQARLLGVGDVALIETGKISIEDRFRMHCENPPCPNYGSSINCPPHSMTVKEFREHIENFADVLAFKFDMPMDILHADKGREAGRLLHETTAALERQAKALGFDKACGYSSGACKNTFCHDHDNCAALESNGACRYPDKARPSLSGMGVNWYKLTETLGWRMLKSEDGQQNEDVQTVMLAGLIFLN